MVKNANNGSLDGKVGPLGKHFVPLRFYQLTGDRYPSTSTIGGVRVQTYLSLAVPSVGFCK